MDNKRKDGGIWSWSNEITNIGGFKTGTITLKIDDEIVREYIIKPGANLEGADLEGAILIGVDLNSANLTSVEMIGGDLISDKLINAKFLIN